MAFRRREGSGSPDEAQEALRQQLLALDELKRELAARVQAVRQREQELSQALDEARRGAAGRTTAAAGQSQADVLAHREAELEARERALSEREAELAAREQAMSGEPAAAAIEARLAELRAAEQLFLRTRDELAARSEAVTAREQLVAQRERELAERDGPPALPPLAIGELEARLRRLEQRQQPGEETQSFSAGFRRLQEHGSRPRRPGKP